MKSSRPRGSIDWAAVRDRVDVAQRLLDDAFTLSPERRREILAARAAALSVEPAPPPGATFEAMAFTLAHEQYALETHWVREVYALREFTPLPGTPAFVLGIVHQRGRIVSVLDLKRFFELPTLGLSDLNKVIVLADGRMEFGILADTVIGVRTLLHDDLQPPLQTLTGIRADYLMGITRQREVVLDGGRLLADPAIVVATDVAD